MNAKRLIVYLMLNVIVSASMTVGVMWLWDETHPAIPAPCIGAESPPVAAGEPITNVPLPTAPKPVAVTPVVYVVQSGDTLGSIAERYNVSVESLMAANSLSDPNLLNVGQTLAMPPSGDAPSPAPGGTPGALPTNAAEPPRPTATPDSNVPLSQLAIREVKSPGTLAEETLIITNQGGPVDLSGWTLRDEASHVYIFPALTLFEGGAVTLHTAAGKDTVTDLYWGLAEPLWAGGRQVLLSDAGGNLHTRFTVP